MSDIFISYARSTTAAQARAMGDALRALGYDVWFDEALPAHRDFGDVIAEHLHTAKAVVVIWSDEAVKSQWVRSEANRAREAGKLVQLVIDDAAVPMPFDQIHCADLRGWNGDTETPGWKKVISSIADLASGPRVSTVQAGKPSLRKNSICVLPFVNMSGDVEQEYFSDGITEDIITDLSKVSSLLVIARNTAFTFKGRSAEVTHAARQLNVSHILQGSVRKAGGRVRITAQLIDGETGGHLWAERYDRELADVFALQDEISQAIVSALKLKLKPLEKASIQRRGTTNLEAYDLYLRGMRPAFNAEQQGERIALLEAATRLAPDYAEAWGELAKIRQFWYWRQPHAAREAIARTVTAEATRALSLDPHNLAALGAQFYLLPPVGHYIDAETLVARMETIAPDHPDVLIRRTDQLHAVGRIREAIDAARRACELDPLDPHRLNDHARQLFDAGRYSEARHVFEDLLERRPDHQGAAINLFQLCLHVQDWVAVDALLTPERLRDLPDLAPWGSLYASLLRSPKADSNTRPIDSARRRFERSGTANFYQLQWAAKTGDADEALTIALRARFGPAGDDRDTLGINADRPYGVFAAMFPEFRRDPRFAQVCGRCGLVEYWTKTQQWPDCVDEVAPYYDFKAECEKVAAGPPLAPANEAGSP
jgi:adenylate cyclase